MRDRSMLDEFFTQIEDIRFKNVDDLYERREEISENFQQKEHQVKELYKWYFFFQLCLLKEPLKGLLWEYIYGERNAFLLLNVPLEYRKLCNRRKQIKKEEIEEDSVL